MSEKKNEQNDDFLDFSTIKEEINDGPSEEEFTRAMDQMSKTDRDIFEDTGIIHIDRDMPAETQAMHVISLQKQNEKRKRKKHRKPMLLSSKGSVEQYPEGEE